MQNNNYQHHLERIKSLKEINLLRSNLIGEISSELTLDLRRGMITELEYDVLRNFLKSAIRGGEEN